MRGKSPTCRKRRSWLGGLRPQQRSETEDEEARFRQVRDLPRIGVAEP